MQSATRASACAFASRSPGRLLNPTQLLLEAKAVIVIALIDDLAVLDPNEGHPVEVEGLVRRRRVGPPRAGIVAGEGPFKRDAIRGLNRLALHLPSEIGRRRHEQLDDLVARCVAAFLRFADGRVEIGDIIGHECSRGIGVVGVPSRQITVHHLARRHNIFCERTRGYCHRQQRANRPASIPHGLYSFSSPCFGATPPRTRPQGRCAIIQPRRASGNWAGGGFRWAVAPRLRPILALDAELWAYERQALPGAKPLSKLGP